jgi:hypothetical protein
MLNKLPGKPRTGKIGKPRPDFPLSPHASGRWAKKVRGKFTYFGRVADDPKGTAALDKWLEQRDELPTGHTPRGARDGVTIRDLCNRFRTNRQGKPSTGELSAVSFADYRAACERIVKASGKPRLVSDLDAGDFEGFRRSLARGWSPSHLETKSVGFAPSSATHGYPAFLTTRGQCGTGCRTLARRASKGNRLQGHRLRFGLVLVWREMRTIGEKDPIGMVSEAIFRPIWRSRRPSSTMVLIGSRAASDPPSCLAWPE